MTSITFWNRLEPRARREDMVIPLQARIHDPLWMLARQWQVGEFEAEDAGSPVSARLRADVGRLTQYYPAAVGVGQQVTGHILSHEELPLEVLVEQEPFDIPGTTGPVPLLAAESGLHFVHLLEHHGAYQARDLFIDDDLRFDQTRYADAPGMDAATRRYCSVLHGRVPDGKRLYERFKDLVAVDSERRVSTLPTKPEIAPESVNAVANAIFDWLADYRTRFAQSATDAHSAWNPERMEYTFSVAAPLCAQEQVLSSQEYHGGHLDWYNFDTVPGAALGAVTDFTGNTLDECKFVDTVIPTPVTYHGMPNSRWWEFEDAQVNLAKVTAGPIDLLLPFFLHFAITYSDDWFMIPLDLPVGTLMRTRSLVITDSFGVCTLIPHYTDADGDKQDWRMFALGSIDRDGAGPDDRSDSLFFVPPVLVGSLNGAPVEEVLFLRDEMANLAWAVEKRIENGIGGPHIRDEAPQEPLPSQAQASTQPVTTGQSLHYRLATQVPDHWIPFVPETLKDGRSIRLVKAAMWTDAGDSSSRGQGRIVGAVPSLQIFEEEVPREGIRVTRHYQYARWLNGKPLLWAGRRKGPGRGEGWSGLSFDSVDGLE